MSGKQPPETTETLRHEPIKVSSIWTTEPIWDLEKKQSAGPTLDQVWFTQLRVSDTHNFAARRAICAKSDFSVVEDTINN